MIQITDIDVYTNRMATSIRDKLFFLKHLHPEVTCILDYGCADGTLLRALPDTYAKLGYDSNSSMIKRCEENGIQATDSMKKLMEEVESVGKEHVAVVCSSVVHEVYSYLMKKEIRQFWEFIFGTGFRQICIRDMMYREKDKNHPVKPEDLECLEKNLSDKQKIMLEERLAIRLGQNTKRVEHKLDITHFLLKYQYVENWNREVMENYFPVPAEQIQRIARQYGYQTEYEEYEVLPYIRQQVYRDLGIWINDTTHGKLVFTQK